MLFTYRDSYSNVALTFKGSKNHFWKFVIDQAKQNAKPFACQQFVNNHWQNIGTVLPNATRILRDEKGTHKYRWSIKTNCWVSIY